MSCNDGNRWGDDLASYALGALEPDEATALERHLIGCEHCRAELVWLQPAVRALPEGVERMQAPRGVRDAVMGEVRADAKRAREAGGAKPSLSERLGWRRPGGGSSRAWQPLAAMAAVALAVVAFAGYEIGSGGSGETHSYEAGRAPGVIAKVIREGDRGAVHVSNVHGLPEDRVLEAWVQREGEVEAVPALFVPNDEGSGSTTIEDMDGVEIVMVTKEPRGGSQLPTSSPIATVPISDS